MEVTTKVEITAPLDRVRERLFDFEGLAGWCPGLTEYVVDGAGVGAVRSYVLGKQVIRERLDAIDEDGRGLGYAVLEGPLPVSDFRARYALLEGETTGTTRVVWFAEFDVMRELRKGMKVAAIAMQDAHLLVLKVSLEKGVDLTQ